MNPVLSIAVDPGDADTVWAGTQYGGGILRTTDGGERWTSLGLTQENFVEAISVAPGNGEDVLVGAGTTRGNIYRSVDGGRSWQRKLTEIGFVRSLVRDPRDSRVVYAGTEGSGVLRSTDGGETWADFTGAIFYPLIYGLAIAGGEPPVLIAGSYGSGLYGTRLSEGGEPCIADDESLCLLGNRFQVTARYVDYSGGSGTGKAVSLTPDTGYFWFFTPSNVEAVIKMVPFCENGRDVVAVYATGLTDLGVTFTVTDTATGQSKNYANPLGTPFKLIRDGPFTCVPSGAAIAAEAAGFEPTKGHVMPSPVPVEPLAVCTPDEATLCLVNGRFRVTARYRDYSSQTGTGKAISLTSDTGYFWFFSASNVEVVLKLVSFCGTESNVNAVYANGLTDLGIEIEVTDTVSGVTARYTNALGRDFELIRDGPFSCP
ncbi:MAG: hypothetical protein L6R30_07220 [Thermoanaerobaculia bacterium]|nr:hypothetical protein [Thermoanaerobaculia bacterium]